MEPFSMLAGPTVAALGAAALHTRRALIYWALAFALTSIIAAFFYYDFARANPAPPFNAPSVLVAVFIVAPTLATFAVERRWFALGRAVSRPVATAALSVPIALLAYVVGLYLAMAIGMSVGVLRP